MNDEWGVFDLARYTENFAALDGAAQCEIWTHLQVALTEALSSFENQGLQSNMQTAHQLASALGSIGLIRAGLYFQWIEREAQIPPHTSPPNQVIEGLLLRLPVLQKGLLRLP